MPKILWMSPYSLHDISSGASIHCRYILESLQQRGFEVWAFSSFTFDRPHGGVATFGDLATFYSQRPRAQIFEFNDRGLHYIYLKSRQTFERQRTCDEQIMFYEHYCDVLERFKPDIVLGYGTGMDSYTCFAEARRRGIKTVYTLMNGKHGHFSFPYFDMVITDSETTSKLYASRDAINCVPIGQFIDSSRVVSPNHNPTYITMINPDPFKGGAIFARIAEYCQKAHPDWKFMVVNSRANFQQMVKHLHTKDDPNNKPYTEYKFENVTSSPMTGDVRQIYAVTKVMVVPSLAYESWGRVASEAMLNNIPVLGHNIGGIPEAIAEGGIIINPPEHCINDNCSLPDDDEIRPYIEGLERLMTEDWSEKIQKSVQNVDREKLTDRLIKILEPLYNRPQGLFFH